MHGRANLSRNIENLVVVAVSIFQDKETAMSHYKQGQQLFYSLFHSKGPYVSLAWLCWANQTRNIRVWKFDCQHIGGNKIQLWNRGSCISGWSEVQSVPDRCDPVRPVTYRSQESDTVCPTHVSLTTFSPSLIQFNTFCFPNFWYFFVWRGGSGYDTQIYKYSLPFMRLFHQNIQLDRVADMEVGKVADMLADIF